MRIITGATVYEAKAKARHVCSVRIANVSENGRRATPGEEIACDLVCMSGGYMPAYQLPLQAGGRLSYDDTKAVFSITRLPEGVRLAGAVNNCCDIEATLVDGRRAGLEAATSLGFHAEYPAGTQAPLNIEPGNGTNYGWPIFTHPRHKEFVDFDEDLQVCDIVNRLRRRLRRTRVGQALLDRRHGTVAGPARGARDGAAGRRRKRTLGIRNRRHDGAPAVTPRAARNTRRTQFQPRTLHRDTPPPSGSRRANDAGRRVVAPGLLRQFTHRMLSK